MKILGADINLKENLFFSFKRYSVWWAILIVTIIFDYLTTLYFVSKLGPNAEANKVIAWLINNLGLYFSVLIVKLLQFVSVVLIVSLSKRVGNLFLLIVILLNCWAVVMNTIPNY